MTDEQEVLDGGASESTVPATASPPAAPEQAHDPSAPSGEPASVPNRRAALLRAVVIIAVVAVGISVVVTGFLIFRVLPDGEEAPRTAAQAAVDKAMQRVQTKPDSIEARLGLVDAYFQHRLYEEALAVLDDARSLKATGTAGAYLEVAYGRVYESMGDTATALRYYDASLESAETFDALVHLGKIALSRGDDTAAVDYWMRATALKPAQAGLRLDVAALYEKQGKYDLALDQVEEAARYLGEDSRVDEALERLRPLVTAGSSD